MGGGCTATGNPQRSRDVVLIGKIDDAKGDARENFNRLRAWKDEQAVHEDKPTA